MLVVLIQRDAFLSMNLKLKYLNRINSVRRLPWSCRWRPAGCRDDTASSLWAVETEGDSDSAAELSGNSPWRCQNPPTPYTHIHWGVLLIMIITDYTAKPGTWKMSSRCLCVCVFYLYAWARLLCASMKSDFNLSASLNVSMASCVQKNITFIIF